MNYIDTYTDIDNNCTTKIDTNNVYHKFCATCNTPIENMKLISETGYFDREIIKKCTCGRIVKY